MNENSSTPVVKETTKKNSTGVPLSITTELDIKVWVEKMAELDDRSVSKFLTRLLRTIKNGNEISLPS